MKKTAIALALSLLGFINVVKAVSNKNNIWYLGLTSGWSQYHDINFYGNGYKNENNTSTYKKHYPADVNHFSLSSLIGYQVNPNFGFELNYTFLGKMNYLGKTTISYFKSQGIQLNSKLSYAISKKMDIYTKIGGMIFIASANQREGKTQIHDHDIGVSPIAALGFEYFLKDNLTTRLDYQWTNNIGNAKTVGTRPDNSLLSLGITYRFDENKNIPDNNLISSSISMPIEKKIDPIINDKKIIKTNILFKFNKFFLSKKGKKELDKFHKQLLSFDNSKYHLIVIGFSDRIGSYNYNQKLSEKRAKIVVDYLISKGIMANKIFIKKDFEKNTISTKNDACKDIKNHNNLIKCLAPDRRVEIRIENDTKI